MERFIPFFALAHREVYRFLRLSRQTIIPPVLSTLMFILIFGFSLGSSIRQIQGFDYIVFILPGLAQMGVINNAYQNSSTSLFMGRMEHSIENLLVAPLSYIEIVLAFLVGCVMRGLTVGAATLFMASFFVDFPFPHFGWLLISWTLTAALFGSMGIVFGLLAERWDHIALFGNFVLMPLIYLGGTFYSVKMLPPFWEKISYLNPVFYAIDTTRYAVLGVSEFGWQRSFFFTLGLTLLFVGVSIQLFRRGYKLIS